MTRSPRFSRLSRRPAVPAAQRVAERAARPPALGANAPAPGCAASLFGQGLADKGPLLLFSYDWQHRQLLHYNRHCHRLLSYSSQELLDLGTGLAARMLHADSLAQLQRNDVQAYTLAFTLAFAPVAAPPSPAALAEPVAALPPGRILLVEDNLVNSLLAETVLRNWGWQVTTAASGPAAIKLFEHRPFDLVLMDMQMPGMDGETAARALRAPPPPRRAATPVIASPPAPRPAKPNGCKPRALPATWPNPTAKSSCSKPCKPCWPVRARQPNPPRFTSPPPPLP